MVLLAMAFIASLLKMFVIIYVSFLTFKFKCPLSGVGNPAGCPNPNGCSTCLLAGSTNNVVDLFGLRACNASASASDWAASFSQCNYHSSAQGATCMSSLQRTCFSSLDNNQVCSACCTIDPLKILEAVSLVITFPLSAIYMAYCLIFWRSNVQQPFASTCVSSEQEVVERLCRLSKAASAITVIIKYVLSSLALFVILFNVNMNLISCNSLDNGSNSLSQNAVRSACGAVIDTNYQVYVLICCAFLLLCLLIFDIYVCQRDRLIGGAVHIGVGVVLLCIIIIAVSGAQFAAISNKTATFTCQNTTTLPQIGGESNPAQ